MQSSPLSDGSENDGLGAAVAAVAAEDVAVVARRGIGERCRSTCCAVDNTRSGPMRFETWIEIWIIRSQFEFKIAPKIRKSLCI